MKKTIVNVSLFIFTTVVSSLAYADTYTCMNYNNVVEELSDQESTSNVTYQNSFELDSNEEHIEHLLTLNDKDIGVTIVKTDPEKNRLSLDLIQMNINGDEDFYAILSSTELTSDITALTYRSIDSDVVISIGCHKSESKPKK